MSNDQVRSPCVNICALDDDDVCVGCFRTGQEITQWWRMDSEGQREVLVKCAEREQASANFTVLSRD